MINIFNKVTLSTTTTAIHPNPPTQEPKSLQDPEVNKFSVTLIEI